MRETRREADENYDDVYDEYRGIVPERAEENADNERENSAAEPPKNVPKTPDLR